MERKEIVASINETEIQLAVFVVGFLQAETLFRRSVVCLCPLQLLKLESLFICKKLWTTLYLQWCFGLLCNVFNVQGFIYFITPKYPKSIEYPKQYFVDHYYIVNLKVWF